MKKALYILISLLILVSAGILYGGYSLVKIAIVPEDNYGQNYETAYAKVYRKYPEMKAWHDSLVAQNLWRDTFLTNDEGLRLHAILIEHSPSDTLCPPQGAMMMIHGYCDDAPVMMRYAYCDYEMQHCNVLLPERRWCGLSEGDHITFGWLDRLDMHLWLDMMHNIWHQPIVVHGLSMGAATTMMLSGDDLPDTLLVAGYIEDCGYSTTWDQLAFQLKEEYGLPPFPLLHAASFVNKLWHGWWLTEGDALGQVARCQKPMLFIHGTKDDYVPFEMVQSLYEAKPGKKFIWEAEETRHARAIHDHWEEYCRRVSDFWKEAKLAL